MQNFRGHVEAFHVNAVDTTGAGDSFVGALLCKIVDDHSLIEVMRTFIFMPLANAIKETYS